MRGFLAILTGAVALVFVALYYVMYELEQALLFQPLVCERYSTDLTSIGMQQKRLPSGAVIWSDEDMCDDVPTRGVAGVVLFLHGNTGNLDLFVPSFANLHELGYKLAAIDYRGYGMAGNVEPSQDNMRQDLLEAWAFLCTRCMHTHNANTPLILIGHSLGGALAVELLYNLLHHPELSTNAQLMMQTYCSPRHCLPSQIVLLQTFTGIHDVIDDWIGVECAHLFPLSVQWPVKEYLCKMYVQDTCPDRKLPSLLIVQCPDDNIIPYSHSQKLYDVFPEGDNRVRFVTLPAGVRQPHRYAVVMHFDQWSRYLVRSNP